MTAAEDRPACDLRFDPPALLTGVPRAGSETERRLGLTSGIDRADGLWLTYAPAAGRSATMRGVDEALEVAWLAPDGTVVGIVVMDPESPGRYRAPGVTGGAIEQRPGVLAGAGVHVGSRLIGTSCTA